MCKGVGNLHHYQSHALACNQRYLEALAAVEDRDTTAAALADELDRVDPIVPMRGGADITVHDHYMVMLRLPRSLRAAGISNSTFADAIVAEGIPAKVLFPPWYATGAYATGAHADADLAAGCPVSEAATTEVICLPHPLLLDPRIPGAAAAAIARLIGSVSGLLTWQTARQASPVGQHA